MKIKGTAALIYDGGKRSQESEFEISDIMLCKLIEKHLKQQAGATECDIFDMTLTDIEIY